MGEKLVVGPFDRGLRNDRPAFMIDNQSFPTLINAYQWRGRIKRKRGTQFLTHLQRFFNSTLTVYNPNPGSPTITLGNDGSGNGTGNLLTGFRTLETNTSIVLGSVTINDTTNGATYTDTNQDGTLLKNGLSDPGSTINYSSGAIVIAGRAGDIVNANFSYFPGIPVMGLKDSILAGMQFPGTLAFDTVYSYNIQTIFPYTSYSVSFYKNPAADPVNLPGYVPKTIWTPVSWNGQDYQQFWTTNYQGALWATNGITVPFSTTNIGMQFKKVTNVASIVAGPPATVQLTISNHGLVVGDFVFLNEFPTANITGINFQTGYVISRPNASQVTVELPFATLGGAGGAITSGIAQYLTSRSDATKDCLRWYDGDPTNGNASSPTFVQGNGWVNFMPPLSQGTYSINDLPAAQYYLVGARIILPFKDRLLFFGPVIQTSSGSPIYLQDTIIYSQNGTPYYTCSYTNTPSASQDTPVSSSNVFNPILIPANQTATSPAYFEDQTGFGGFVSAGIDRAITTASTNEDALIVGFDSNIQTRVIYSGNDIVPFNFFIINAELGSASTFSVINLDHGVITKGNRGYIITSQTEVSRIDLEIPDEVFETLLTNNGTERVTAQRDFQNEWIYFSYPSDLFGYIYPTKTLQYNYRDNSWAVFYESYTTYGSFRKTTGLIWSTVGNFYPTWNQWNDPWDEGTSELLQPDVIGGNQQGFVLIRGIGTGEGTSLQINGVSGTSLTVPNHCLNTGDFIVITGALGTIASSINSIPFVINVTDNNTITVGTDFTGLTYLGGGLITRFYVPQIQTKQFPSAWGLGRKTRIGPQQYLFTKTDAGQITLQIFLSQNSESPYNFTGSAPNPDSDDSFIYSQILYTCPESTNLGLTPFNANLQTPTAPQQAQIWHRMNTSLIGDTVQIGFTLSQTQMLDPNLIFQTDEIELHGFILDVQPSQLLV